MKLALVLAQKVWHAAGVMELLDVEAPFKTREDVSVKQPYDPQDVEDADAAEVRW